ncbi:MAG: methyltransferase domain-containing protein [Candidatus Kapaibacterium sp.]|jgi:16S rRNA (cytosine967-C5)-methyltransferase
MRTSSLIGHVIEIYSMFAKNPERPADNYIRVFFFERKYLGSKDRRFIADAFFGIVKYFRRLDAIVRDVMPEAAEDPASIVAAYFAVIEPIPPRELSDEWRMIAMRERQDISLDAFSAMASSAREIERLSKLTPMERLAIAYSFPDWFVVKMSEEYGAEKVEEILNALNDQAPTVLRANKLLVRSRDELAKELASEECDTTNSTLAEDALILPKRMNVQGTKAFKRGAFEVQDEASQLVAPLAKLPRKTVKVLDACAGAGGKTLHIAALLENQGEIFATDPDPRKLIELKKRARRSGAQNIRIVQPDEREHFLKRKSGWFDLVLLDVPCTGTGTLRRNPGIKSVLTEVMLAELVEKQRFILEENAHYVAVGGVLLYATCSLLKAESEDQSNWLVSKFPGEFEVEEAIRTRPDLEGCDGFYAARIRRVK